MGQSVGGRRRGRHGHRRDAHRRCQRRRGVWSAIEWIKFGKPSLVGAVTGAIAGLATVPPTSGFVGPVGGLILGAAAGAVCFFAVDMVKKKLKIESVVTDDLVAQVVATIREVSTTGQADRPHIWVSGVLSEETGEA